MSENEINENQIMKKDDNKVDLENSNQEAQPEKNFVEERILELEQKNIDLNDKLLRSLAELDNVRRRSREEIEKSARFAISGFVGELVSVVEIFFLACDNSPREEIEKNANVKNFADAVDMTKKELLKILEKNQVKRIFPLNEKFDHNFHEAISQIESETEEETVIQVVQAGYTISERLIRPALVVVAKKLAS